MDPLDRDSVSSGASGSASNAGKAAKTNHSAGNDDSKNTGDEGHRDAQAVYHDYSRDKSMLLLSSEEPRESIQTFPMKLHSILSNPEFSNTVSWLPHGRAFRILQHKSFEEKVIPLYFRHGRYSSFARQVNGWGFKRIAHGPDYNSYYHELFLRGIPRLCEKMKRLSGKDEKKNEESSDAPAPDFYALSRQNPLPEDNDDMQAIGKHGSNTGESARISNGGFGFTAGGLGDLSSLLRSQAGGTNGGGGGGDVLVGLVLQALELRRNEIMQRLSSLVAEGFASSVPQSQSSGTDPLSSIVSLLTAQQQASVPASMPGNIGDLVANLLRNGGNASSAARQPAASAGAGFQGLHHLANKAANSQAASGLDILALLRQQQEYQHSKPPAQSPSQFSAPATASDLQQQLLNNPSTAALFQQLQGTLLGNSSSSSQAPASQTYSGNTSRLTQGGGQNGAQFRSAMGAPSSEARPISETHHISNGNSSGFQLPLGVDIKSLLSSGPNALANLASLLQNQRSNGDNGAGPPPAAPSSISQHNETQNRSPQFPATNGHAPSTRSPQPHPSTNPAAAGLPATIASLLGQMQQNRGQQPPTNSTAALISQLRQQNRLNHPQEMVSQDPNNNSMMMRQQQQQNSGMMNTGMMNNNQVSQLQALLGQQQPGISSDWQSLFGQANHQGSSSQGVDIRAQLQRQPISDHPSGLLGLQHQVLGGGGGNLSLEQVQLAALLGLGTIQGSSHP